MRAKKVLCVLITVLIISGVFAGCVRKNNKSVYISDNEIYTYQKIDSSKTQIVVSRTGNISVIPFCKEFELKNPDIQVIYLDITGGNSTYTPLAEWAKNGDLPDIVFSASDFSDSEMAEQYLENLSLNPVIHNYEAAALQRTAINGEIYWLPGPSDINAMMYNKTLFAQYGWSVPKTFDDFVALCDRITKDTGGEVEPWNPNAKYNAELSRALQAFTYAEVFGGIENRTWYDNFIAGNGTLEGHIEPYMETIETLVEHGILKNEHFSYSATTRGKEFADGKIAMINMNIYNADNDKYDFGYMAYPTTKGDIGYLCDSYSCYVGISKKEHTEKENDAINRFVEFFSSAEGQEIYIDKSLKVSNVKNVNVGLGDSDLTALQSVIDAGNMFADIGFASTKGYKKVFSLQQDAIDITSGKMTGEECIKRDDANLYMKPTEIKPAEPEIIATVGEDMTILETSFYMADCYRELLGTEIGLIANNETYRGNVMKFYKSDITADMIDVFKPRSLENNSKLQKVAMTGRQLLEALNHPLGYTGNANCIYAYSGLTCEVAPWNEPGEKYLSVKLSNGAEIEPDTMYYVAIWEGTVADEYITEVCEAYEGTWEALMREKLKSDGIIKPTGDNRIKLVWN